MSRQTLGKLDSRESRHANYLVSVIFTVLILTTFPLNITTDAMPSIIISQPSDGTRLTQYQNNITGHASGSDIKWVQTNKTDFDIGKMENISSELPGYIRITNGTYDDFNDNSLDETRWERIKEDNGIKATEICETYQASGQANTSYQSNRCWTVSKKNFYNGSFSADLIYYPPVAPEVDNYGNARFGLYFDQYNYLSVGIGNDGQMVRGYRREISVKQESSYWHGSGVLNESLAPPEKGPHHFLFIWNSTEINIFVDGIYVLTNINYWGDPKIFFDTEAYVGQRVCAVWDNATENKFSGRYISSIFDTKAIQTKLKSIDWNSTVPNGTSLSIFIRSSDDSSMNYPTPWIAANDSLAGLTWLKRYVQYAVIMNSTDGIATSILDDIEIVFDKPIMKVEISIDDKDTWRLAHGTTDWYLVVNLAENQNIIWVRTTDCAGDFDLYRITVDVDTTLPVGWVLINHGNKYTPTLETNLTLNASDHYGVVSMMLSEDPDFKGMDWQQYETFMNFTLSPGDGQKTVYAKFKDSSSWESELSSDTIILDTEPPVGEIKINDGAEYANNSLVSLTLKAEDLSGVLRMQICGDESFSNVDWEPYQTTRLLNLALGSGLRNVYVRFMDGAGHISDSVMDSIKVDDILPDINVSINGGAIYITNREISLAIVANDNYGIKSMILSEDFRFSGCVWEPYQTIRSWVLSPGDGKKIISAKALDIAGNVGPTNSTSIILDTMPPASSILPLSPVSNSTNITVEWNGSDATSGILSYDMQFKDGEGLWQDWIITGNITKTIFTGQDGHSYSFRVRARDNAGNVQQYPAIGTGPVTIVLPTPSITIKYPSHDIKVHGKIDIRGISDAAQPDKSVSLIQICIDNGTWRTAQGTNSWTLAWDTTTVPDGTHFIRARAFDGRKYSPEAKVIVKVDNSQSRVNSDNFPYPVLLLIIIMIGIGMSYYLYRRSKG